METNRKKGMNVVIKGVLIVAVIIAIIGAFYLIRNYTGFGGYPTMNVQNLSPSIVHASTNGTDQYTWTLSPQISVQNHGTAAASHVQVLWSISGGPLTHQIQGISDVGTIVPGSTKTVSWSFTTGLTAAPFPTYIVTATVEYAQGPNIVATFTLTPPASCAQTPPSSACS